MPPTPRSIVPLNAINSLQTEMVGVVFPVMGVLETERGNPTQACTSLFKMKIVLSAPGKTHGR
jgi:hypothetical protein